MHIRWIVLLAIAMEFGCASSSRPSAQSATAPATRRSETPTTKAVYPLVYDRTQFGGRSRDIATTQAQKLFRAAESVCPDGRRIWFVVITDVEAEVYYTPDLAGPRLRRGRFLKCPIIPTKAADLDDWRTYAQVSPAARPFGQALDVPEAGSFLPFEIAESEDRPLVAIMDAFQKACAANSLMTKGQRVRGVGYEKDGVNVSFGFEETTGEMIMLMEMKDGSFEYRGHALWVSP